MISQTILGYRHVCAVMKPADRSTRASHVPDSKRNRYFQSTGQVRAFVASGGADEGAERNVFANGPLGSAAKIPISMTTGPRIRQKSKYFREQSPFLIQYLPDCLTNKPAIVVEVRAGDVDRVISGIKVQARLPDGVSRDSHNADVRISCAEPVPVGRGWQFQVHERAELQLVLEALPESKLGRDRQVR
jgi:hypothetical protein